MDIQTIVASKKHAICCRSADEMRWVERQFQMLGVYWVTGRLFYLYDWCWDQLKDSGHCCFGNDHTGRMCYGTIAGYTGSHIIVEAADLMTAASSAYDVKELLDLL